MTKRELIFHVVHDPEGSWWCLSVEDRNLFALYSIPLEILEVLSGMNMAFNSVQLTVSRLSVSFCKLVFKFSLSSEKILKGFL